MTRLQRFAWATLGSTLVLVAIGGYTRGSGSGFGCEDRWPLCKNGAVGGLLPRWEHNMVIEWTHRWVAAIVGVLALLTAIAAWRDRRTTRAVAGPAIAAVVLISAQAYLGRMVVKNELDADLVALHLANAMAVIGLLAVVAVNARRSTGRGEVPGEVLAPAERVWVGMLATGAALSLLVLLLGSSVHNEYVGGWPLVGNELIPDLASRVVQVHFAHRVAAGMLLVYCAWLAVRVVHLRRPRREVLLVHGAAGGVLINALLGAAHVVTKVQSSAIVVAHLAVASLTWTVLLLAALYAAQPRTAPVPLGRT